jgi:hypothetical protein
MLIKKFSNFKSSNKFYQTVSWTISKTILIDHSKIIDVEGLIMMNDYPPINEVKEVKIISINQISIL